MDMSPRSLARGVSLRYAQQSCVMFFASTLAPEEGRCLAHQADLEV